MGQRKAPTGEVEASVTTSLARLVLYLNALVDEFAVLHHLQIIKAIGYSLYVELTRSISSLQRFAFVVDQRGTCYVSRDAN